MAKNIICLIRDLIKTIYQLIVQMKTRLFFVDRQIPSSISFSAILDVIPLRSHHTKNQLIVEKRTVIEKGCVVNTWQGSVILRKGAGIGIRSIVLGPVVFEEGARCSQHCFISGQSHNYQDISKHFFKQGFDTKEVIIGENAWVGSNCVILPGVRIGKHSVIGAGSVVTKDIPAYRVAVGNPARIIKKYCSDTKAWVNL